MRGNIYEYCKCRDLAGKVLKVCPDRAKRGHLTYGYRVSVPTGPGSKRQQPRTGGFKTRADAERSLRATLTALDQNTYGLTVGQYLPQWLESKGRIRVSTSHSYAGHIRCHLIPELGHLRLAELKPSHVEALYRRLAEDGMSARTVQRVHATLRAAFNSALRRGLIERNVVLHVELVGAQRYQAATWTPDQVGQFLDYLRDSEDRLAALYQLLVLRGPRRGEAVGLRWSDVDLDAATATIEQAVAQVGHNTYVQLPKMRGDIRRISLDADTVEALRQHRAAQARERAACGQAWRDQDNRVFTGVDGQGLHPGAVTKHFYALTEAAGLPRIRLHDLRHTAATIALEAGVPLKTVSDMLGHTSLATTADTYTHVRLSVALEAAEMSVALVPRRCRS